MDFTSSACDAACAASPAHAARCSDLLRGMTHEIKLEHLRFCLQHNFCALLCCHLAAGSTPNARFPQMDNVTALQLAAFAGSEDASRLLIDAGASLDAVDAVGTTALFTAAYKGHARVCSLLLARGADVKIHSRIGYTALHAAAQGGNVSAIEAFVRDGAVLDDAANDGQGTLLALAVQTQHLDAVTKLLELGALANICDLLATRPSSRPSWRTTSPSHAFCCRTQTCAFSTTPALTPFTSALVDVRASSSSSLTSSTTWMCALARYAACLVLITTPTWAAPTTALL